VDHISVHTHDCGSPGVLFLFAKKLKICYNGNINEKNLK
jgi:hypothetical protein